MSPPDALPGALLVPQPSLEDFPDFVSIPIRIGQHKLITENLAGGEGQSQETDL